MDFNLINDAIRDREWRKEVECLEADLAFYKRGVEVWRQVGTHHIDGYCPPHFKCDVCAWEAEAKKREVE